MSEKPKRDARGRWLPESTGNRNGRPRKLSRIDTGDTMRFKNELLEVPTPEGPWMMTREAAVQHRLYEAAMKGNVQALIFLIAQI